MSEIIDVSQPIDASTVVWPGDTPYAQRLVMEIGGGCPCNVTTMTMSVHCGTHSDAPLHFDPAGAAPAALDLRAYVGPCLVVEVRSEDAIRLADLEGIDLGACERVLFKTKRPSSASAWRDDFLHVSEEAAHALAAARVLLVGTDAASVDPMTSKTLRAHHVLNDAGVRLLENLVLAHVEPGRYELIALPIKLATADAAPVRAVLRRETAGSESS